MAHQLTIAGLAKRTFGTGFLFASLLNVYIQHCLEVSSPVTNYPEQKMYLTGFGKMQLALTKHCKMRPSWLSHSYFATGDYGNHVLDTKPKNKTVDNIWLEENDSAFFLETRLDCYSTYSISHSYSIILTAPSRKQHFYWNRCQARILLSAPHCSKWQNI